MPEGYRKAGATLGPRGIAHETGQSVADPGAESVSTANRVCPGGNGALPLAHHVGRALGKDERVGDLGRQHAAVRIRVSP
jgi:hypothetical protein